jgi:hypothetical protein
MINIENNFGYQFLEFIKLEETSKIILWDQKEDIGYIDEIDKKLLELF